MMEKLEDCLIIFKELVAKVSRGGEGGRREGGKEARARRGQRWAE